jgi:branched-subunit amino acid ABC-type transport system permease component
MANRNKAKLIEAVLTAVLGGFLLGFVFTFYELAQYYSSPLPSIVIFALILGIILIMWAIRDALHT